MNKLKLILLSLCLMMVACDANDSISRENRCQFIFDTTLHPLPCHLTGIIGNNGHFCQVQTYVDNQGIRHLKTTRNYTMRKMMLPSLQLASLSLITISVPMTVSSSVPAVLTSNLLPTMASVPIVSQNTGASIILSPGRTTVFNCIVQNAIAPMMSTTVL